MAGPFSLQRVPSALLSLFGIKSTGANPNQLAPFVQGTVDLRPFFGAETLQLQAAVNATVVNIGDRAAMTVPSGESWLLYGVSSQLVLAVNDAVVVNLGLQMLSPGLGPQIYYVGASTTVTRLANDIVSSVGMLPYPILLPSGTVIFAELGKVLANVPNGFACTALFNRLAI
jgi:hypothetical protein